jgi:hypothetical protein
VREALLQELLERLLAFPRPARHPELSHVILL